METAEEVEQVREQVTRPRTARVRANIQIVPAEQTVPADAVMSTRTGHHDPVKSEEAPPQVQTDPDTGIQIVVVTFAANAGPNHIREILDALGLRHYRKGSQHFEVR